MVNFSFAKKYFKGLLFPVSMCYTLGIATQEIEVNKLTKQDNEVLRAIANARLIAAAPALLDAAKKVNALSIQTDAHKELRDAFAKATGGKA